jgi:hypothetical protein
MVVDILLVIYLAVNVALGFRFGLFRRILNMAAFCLGLLLSRGMSTPAAQNFSLNTGKYPVAGHFGIFLGIVLFIVVVAELLMLFYNGPLGFFNALLFDRFFGAVAGLVFAAIQLSVILYLFNYAAATQGPGGTGQPEIVDAFSSSVSQSLLAKPLKGIEPPATGLLRPFLPGEPAKYFAQSFS